MARERRFYFHKGDVEKARRTVGPLPAPWPRPALVMLSGLPGTGKSSIARRLTKMVPMAVVSTDAIRMALVRRPRYTWQESRKVYEVCHYLLDELLAKGIPTIFDATNLMERYRKTVYEIAEKNNAKLIVVETTAPPEVIMERMRRRECGEDRLDLSEANWAVYLKLKETATPIEREHFTIDTSQDVEPILKQIVKEIRN